MAQYTDQVAEDLVPIAEQTPTTMKFFRWILSIYSYFFYYTNSSIAINQYILSGQAGVLIAYCKDYIGVDVEIKDNFTSIFFPYRNPFDSEIIISADASLEQFNAIVELFNFYRLAEKRFVYRYGNVVVDTNQSPWEYFELGFNNLPPVESYVPFELGFN
jgi:hypothetical protein